MNGTATWGNCTRGVLHFGPNVYCFVSWKNVIIFFTPFFVGFSVHYKMLARNLAFRTTVRLQKIKIIVPSRHNALRKNSSYLRKAICNFLRFQNKIYQRETRISLIYSDILSTLCATDMHSRLLSTESWITNA